MAKNIWKDGMMGLIVGDALGVPVQFCTREELKERAEGPVTGMEGHGTYDMPAGTWSDDSSMALATMAAILIKQEIDPEYIMRKFLTWMFEGAYTPFGEAFDQGNTCTTAIFRYEKTRDVTTCGCTAEDSNGNGSLMRILPVCLYLYEKQKKYCMSEDEAVEAVHAVSALTHGHLRSKMCCGLYYFMTKHVIDGARKEEKPALAKLLAEGLDEGFSFYGRDIRNLTERAHFGRLYDLAEFAALPEDEVRSTGYVVDSLEAAVYCLLNSNSYEECVLKAVNLGDDTDTVAAIAGGIAGLYYGEESIPVAWREEIKKRDWIERLCIQAYERFR